jgi:hypothetical protein
LILITQVEDAEKAKRQKMDAKPAATLKGYSQWTKNFFKHVANLPPGKNGETLSLTTEDVRPDKGMTFICISLILRMG